MLDRIKGRLGEGRKGRVFFRKEERCLFLLAGTCNCNEKKLGVCQHMLGS